MNIYFRQVLLFKLRTSFIVFFLLLSSSASAQVPEKDNILVKALIEVYDSVGKGKTNSLIIKAFKDAVKIGIRYDLVLTRQLLYAYIACKNIKDETIRTKHEMDVLISFLDYEQWEKFIYLMGYRRTLKDYDILIL
jgi:hypothetical protein